MFRVNSLHLYSGSERDARKQEEVSRSLFLSQTLLSDSQRDIRGLWAVLHAAQPKIQQIRLQTVQRLKPCIQQEQGNIWLSELQSALSSV